MEMGADVVKLNMPKIDPDKDKDAPAPYNEMEVDQAEAIRQCVESAGRALVVLSGGSKVDDETVLSHTREVMEAGGSRRHLRPQRLAARVERGAGDHRPDQGDAALQRAPHPRSGAEGRDPPAPRLGRGWGATRRRGRLGSVVLLVARRAADPAAVGAARDGAERARRAPRPASCGRSTATRSKSRLGGELEDVR